MYYVVSRTAGTVSITDQLFLSSQTLSLGSGSVTNLAITTQAPIQYLTATGDVSWYSIDASTDNLFYFFFNSSAYNITLVHDDGATGTAAERFDNPGDVSFVIPPGQWVFVWYNTTTDRWNPGVFPLPSQWPVADPATITTDQNNYNPGAGVVVTLNVDSAATITGFAARPDGSPLFIINNGDSTLTLANLSGSSSSANQIITASGGDLTVPAKSFALLVYDGDAAMWRATTFGNVAGGTFTGPVTFSDVVTFSDPIVYTPATASISANQNNYTPLDSANWHVDVSGTRDLTGLDATGISNGTTYYVTNVGSGEWVFKHNSGSSTTGNKLFTNTGQDYALKQNQTALVEYISTLDSGSGGWLVTPLQIGGSAYVDSSGKLVTQTSATGTAGINLPHGTAPTSPANGDVWTTTTAMYVRINGSTIQLGAGGSLADGDYGDVTVSSSGTVITINAGVVTYAKMQDVSAASKLLGRGSASGSGDVEEIAMGDGVRMNGTTLDTFTVPDLISDTSLSSPGNVTDYDPVEGGRYWSDADGTHISVTATSGVVLQSMLNTAVADGYRFVLFNASDTVTLTIAHRAVAVTSNFTCPDQRDFYLRPFGTVWITWVDGTGFVVEAPEGPLADPGADAVRGWDDSASREAYLSASDARTALGLGSIATLSIIDLTTNVTGDLPFANLAQGSALSVLGVTGNATADNASIAAGSDHQVLRRSGTAVAFGAVNLASSNAVTGVLPIANFTTGTPDGTKFVRDDGVLATPSGGGTEATQAEMEAATGSTQMVTPRRVNNSPGVAKGWVTLDGTDNSNKASLNVTSLTDNAAGDVTVVWDTDFSSGEYVVGGITRYGDSGGGDTHLALSNSTTDQATGSVRVRSVGNDGNNYDSKRVEIMAFGDQ